MRTLVYKRTHHGNPDEPREFGIFDCMGRVRSWNFQAVIGVRGVGPEPISFGLDGKVNWLGIGPHKRRVAGQRGPLVTFDRFVFFGSRGPDFEALAPILAERIYSKNVRVIMTSINAAEQREVDALLALAKDAPPSSARGRSRRAVKGCSR